MTSASRTVLVTGAAGGIGAATARRLASLGHRLFLLDRDASRLSALAEALPVATALAHDLGDATIADAVRDAIGSQSDALDAVVHAAGVAPVLDDARDAVGDLDRMLQINLAAAVRLTVALVPLLRRSGSGRVVHVGSVQADRSAARSVAYAASKGGLHAATRALAVDLAADGILVNAVAPGFVDTPMALLPDGRKEYDTEWFRTVFVDHAGIPLRRPGTPDEVAAVIALLLAPENTYMTGAVIAVDGGLGAAL
ncbi:SDR family NAD(P)-dependent oxidoreductase [Microbacterium sp. LjRoot45]|uniref:SDR family NAD(P)-dependent oxidoreductase n=1 Tax=Microbacterium sp. LjRoot45 TaxID=3342329 RepID=UPI003ECD55EA